MTPAQPARIHLLPAVEAPVVVVVRRKPSKLFHIIRVNTVTGAAEHGAWFSGQLYPMRCDVSFDGNWFVFLAMGSGGRTWNAVSQLPTLKAIGGGTTNVGTYFGGGYWRARDVLCLNTWHPQGEVPFRVEGMRDVKQTEDLGVLYPRLLRDGWRRRGDNWGRKTVLPDRKQYTVICEGDDGWERRPSPKHPTLIMWYAGFFGIYTFRFRVREQPDLLDDDVDWANYDSRGQLVVARKGVVTIYGPQDGMRFHLRHTLDFEAARPRKRKRE
ncbi:MAG TPA: hypothetical protein VN903_01885 [Polyangia bacterium]|jgi:hypothetical protein|nr:hypothetical protein [Polyangia bacterium]